MNDGSTIHKAEQNHNIPVICSQRQCIRVERKYMVSQAVDDGKILLMKHWDRNDLQTLWNSGHTGMEWSTAITGLEYLEEETQSVLQSSEVFNEQNTAGIINLYHAAGR